MKFHMRYKAKDWERVKKNEKCKIETSVVDGKHE